MRRREAGCRDIISLSLLFAVPANRLSFCKGRREGCMTYRLRIVQETTSTLTIRALDWYHLRVVFQLALFSIPFPSKRR